jgi:hypothetical protein
MRLQLADQLVEVLTIRRSRKGFGTGLGKRPYQIL